MASSTTESSRILHEIETLKSAKSDLERRISALESQLHDLNHPHNNGVCNASSTSPSAFPHGLSPDMIYRYSRHLLLPSFGVQGLLSRSTPFSSDSNLLNNFKVTAFILGQLRLSKSSILVVGAGGLGSPALLYLAASGVGKMIVHYNWLTNVDGMYYK